MNQRTIKKVKIAAIKLRRRHRNRLNMFPTSPEGRNLIKIIVRQSN